MSHALRGQMMSNLYDVIRKWQTFIIIQDKDKELGFDKAVWYKLFDYRAVYCTTMSQMPREVFMSTTIYTWKYISSGGVGKGENLALYLPNLQVIRNPNY